VRGIRLIFVLPAVVLVVNVLSIAQITVDIEGGKIAQPQQAANPKPSTKLTNQDIIYITGLKLSDDVIIDKIHSTEALDFDTSVAGLKLLKADNVSDAVIRAMLNPHPINAGVSSAATAAQPANPYAGLGEGIYLVLTGKPMKVPIETFATYVDHGLTYRIENPHSQFQVSNPLEFIVITPKKGPGPTVLVRLDEKHHHREARFRLQETIDRRGKLEVRKLDDNQISFDRELIDSRTYRIRLQTLSKGEYGFPWFEPNDFVQNGSILQHDIVTFAVID
jgi:hypothetical protein